LDDGLNADLARQEKIGCYLLPGAAADPRLALAEARIAEVCGMSAVWLAEKYDLKDLPSLAGAISQVTTSVRIGAAVTHLGMRHPLVVAAMSQTLQEISYGRFRIGFGRAWPAKWRSYGVQVPTLAAFADFASLLRRLWAGETISYHGPAGDYPEIRLDLLAKEPPAPLLLAAVGPKTLETAGAHFDGVILHPFLTPEAVSRSARLARRAHEQAGRDPAEFLVLSTIVTAHDRTTEEQEQAVAARALRYLQVPGLGEALCAVNNWDPATLVLLRDVKPGELASGRIPSSWLTSTTAVGGLDECESSLRSYFQAGADELILHGSSAPALSHLAAHLTRVA
jgi:5,10-methylenetetrahydromethanopterin reductase